MKPLRAASFGVLAVALLVCGPWVGWCTLIPLTVASLMFVLTDRGLQTSARPEHRLAVAWLSAELAISVSVALTGGPRSPAVSWLVLPVVTLAARFSVRRVIAGSSVVAALILASSLGVAPAEVIAEPQQVVFRLALLGAVALLSLALMQSDLRHRSASVIDPLTSMLNRNALGVRVEELRHQARIVQPPIGLIVCDLDRFKAVNDTRGHDVGDDVLRDVAYSPRKHLRETVLAQHQGGLSVTTSFGVSASHPSSFDYEHVFAAADRALLRSQSRRAQLRTRRERHRPGRANPRQLLPDINNAAVPAASWS